MKRLIVYLLLIVIAALFNGEMDTIQFAPMRAWFDGWWIEQNWQQSWWQKYLLPFTVDGWHFCKAVYMISLYSVIADSLRVSLRLEWFWTGIIFSGVMLVHGLVFNLTYLI